jgi:hypothetical protein
MKGKTIDALLQEQMAQGREKTLQVLDRIFSSKAVDFEDKLLELLKKFGLNPKFIRGQAMDGCSVMSGVHGGLQALVRQISLSALYVHLHSTSIEFNAGKNMNNLSSHEIIFWHTGNFVRILCC